MNDNEKYAILKAVVSNFVLSRRSFTSVEICNSVKRAGIWIRNRDVASYIRNNIIDISKEYSIDYTTSMIIIDNQSATKTFATLYSEVGYNVANYLSRDLKAITPKEFERMHGHKISKKEENRNTVSIIFDVDPN